MVLKIYHDILKITQFKRFITYIRMRMHVT